MNMKLPIGYEYIWYLHRLSTPVQIALLKNSHNMKSGYRQNHKSIAEFLMANAPSEDGPGPVVDAAFLWAESPEGHEYWSNISNSEPDESDCDRVFPIDVRPMTTGEVPRGLKYLSWLSPADQIRFLRNLSYCNPNLKISNYLLRDWHLSGWNCWIAGAFDWELSPEGHDHWSKINAKHRNTD